MGELMAKCRVCRTREAVTRFRCRPFDVEVAPGQVISVPAFVCCESCAKLVRECDYLQIGNWLAVASVTALGHDPGPLLVHGCRRLAAALVACVAEESPP